MENISRRNFVGAIRIALSYLIARPVSRLFSESVVELHSPAQIVDDPGVVLHRVSEAGPLEYQYGRRNQTKKLRFPLPIDSIQ